MRPRKLVLLEGVVMDGMAGDDRGESENARGDVYASVGHHGQGAPVPPPLTRLTRSQGEEHIQRQLVMMMVEVIYGVAGDDRR